MTFSFSTSYITLWTMVICLGLIAVEVLRELQKLQKVVTTAGFPNKLALPIGTPAPSFAAYDLRIGQITQGHLFDSSGGIVLFLSPSCTICKRLVHSLIVSKPSLVMTTICRGRQDECRTFLRQLGTDIPLFVDSAGTVGTLYQVLGPPTAVILDGDGRIRGTGHPKDATELKFLVEMSMAHPIGVSATRPGDGREKSALANAQI